MKKLTVSFGRYHELVAAGQIPHPERCATKNVGWDVVIGTFSARSVMARTVRMQEKRAGRSDDWRPVVKLSDGEGF